MCTRTGIRRRVDRTALELDRIVPVIVQKNGETEKILANTRTRTGIRRRVDRTALELDRIVPSYRSEK